MSQEIYVKEMPKVYYDSRTGNECIETKGHFIVKNLHDHDRELVEKVIKEVEENFTKYLPLNNRTGAWFYGRLNEILKKYQKEFEDEK